MSIKRKSVIELKELRIGNYLFYKGELVHVTTLSLDVDDELEDTIGFCKHGQIHNETSDWNRALYNDLERIPLIPEWLERCGGNKCKGTPFYEIDMPSNIGQIHVNPDNGMIWLKHHANEHIALNPASGNVYYLHQLQNLYFVLTGEELKLKGQ